MKSVKLKPMQKGLTREERGGEMYEYYPLGKYVVAAPGVCGGKPTFKYTRIKVEFVLDLLGAGWSIDRVAREYHASRLTAEAVKEAIQLARKAFVKSMRVLKAAA